MIVTAISDLHGQIDTLENIIPESDILCICGDIIPLNIQNNIEESDKWFSKVFIPKLQSLKVNEIYIIAGNHDKFMENRKHIIEDMLIGTNITYLEDEVAEYLDEETGKVWKIWGTPWCHIFGNWSFMREPEFLKEKYSLIPDDTDILLTHDAPFGRNDVLLEGFWRNGKHIGNYELVDELDIKHPKYHFTGHLHSTDHNLVDYEGTMTACVSLLDEDYEINYDPLTIIIK